MRKKLKLLLSVFWVFFRIGAFTFGGGYAMIPLITEEAVTKRKWISEQDILDIFAIAESTPGPIAINSATFVGYRTAGVLGSLCATLGVVLPSFIIILIVAKCYEKFKTNRFVKGAMSGLKPAVIGLIGAAVLSIGQTVFFPNGLSFSVFSGLPFYVSAVIFIGMAVCAFKKLHPIAIIGISAVLGIVAGYTLPLGL
jgi:chromate transporter